MRRALVSISVLALVTFGCAKENDVPARAPVVEVNAPPQPSAVDTVATPDAPPSPPPATRAVTEGSEIKVELAGSMILNGRDLGSAPKLTDFEAILGKADRVEEKVNRIHIYERFGVILYEPYNGQITAVNIYFTPDQFSFVPKGMYTGAVTLSTRKLSGSTKNTELASISGVSFDSHWSNYKFQGSGYSVILDPKKQDHLAQINVAFDASRQVPVGVKNGPIPTEEGCLKGDVAKCNEASFAYQTGTGVSKDSTKARTYAKLACDGNLAFGCTNLALLVQREDHTASGRAEAQKHFEKACRLGDKVGCVAIGR